jgi:ferredoxin--NADP+ reductase
MVFRSVGYRGIPIQGVPFDEKAGKIPNVEGRVAAGEYVVGWAKRGPSGLIGTNRADSVATVNAMLADAKAGKFGAEPQFPTPEAVDRLLKERGLRYVSFAGWKTLDRIEVERGKKTGKIREKFTRVAEMLDAVETGDGKVPV